MATWDGDACQLEESEAGRGDRKRPRGVKGPPPTQGGAEARSQGCGKPLALRGGNSPGGGQSLQRLGQNERGTDGQKPLDHAARTPALTLSETGREQIHPKIPSQCLSTVRSPYAFKTFPHGLGHLWPGY